MDKDIYIIRHGQTAYNKSGIVQGSGIDSSLNEMGRIQARQFFDFYEDKVDFDLIIHSALMRSRQTIGPWLMGRRIEVREDARINEISWGDHEGKKSTPEDKELYLHIMNEWASGNYEVGISNGETAAELYARLTSFVEDLKKMGAQTILICSHGRSMKCLMSVLKGEPPSEMQKYSIKNVGLYKLRQVGEDFIFELENDVKHRPEL